jgi:hypothetical protein
MKRILIITILILTTSWITGKILDFYYCKFWKGTFQKLDTVFKDSSYRDIIFVGDSRTHFGINPFYIDSITKLNSYNIGMGGATIDEINFLTRAWFKNHSAPKFLFLNIGQGAFLKNESFFENPCYYFFYLKDQQTNETLAQLGYHTTLYKYFPILKYTAFDEFNKVTILKAMQGNRFLQNEGISVKGFINNNNSNDFNSNLNKSFYDNVENANIQKKKNLVKFELLVNYLSKFNCKLFFLYPPDLKSESLKEDSVLKNLTEDINKIATKYQTTILRYDSDSSFTKELFQDPRHLNINGSIVYSKKIAAQLLLNQ